MTTARPKTYIHQRRTERRATQEQILALTGHTDADICEKVNAYGTLHLIDYLGQDTCTNEILRSSAYWDWYTNQWHLRDEHFIEAEPGIAGLPQQRIRERYAEAHLLFEPRYAAARDRFEKALEAFVHRYIKKTTQPKAQVKQ